MTRAHRTTFLTVALGLLLALGVSAQSVPSSEEISGFATAVHVRADGIVEVSERIDYYFPSPRHGIFRDIPTRYVDDAGAQYRIPLAVESVLMDGTPARYRLETQADGIRIRIGDPDRTISGRHEYAITYTAKGALRALADHDELYWNATGTEWEVPIRRASASVTVDGVDGKEFRLACYTGPRGSTASDCVFASRDGSAEFAANERLTVVVGWPKGRVPIIPPEREATWPKFIPIIFPLVLLAWLLRRWWRNGRDPKGQGTLVVQYDPPDKLPPAELGILIRENTSVKDISATIVDLAVRGFITIKETEKKGLLHTSTDYEFSVRPDWRDDAMLTAYERKVIGVLIGKGEPGVLSKLSQGHDFFRESTAISNAMKRSVLGRGYFVSDPAKTRLYYFSAGVVLLVVLWLFSQVASRSLILLGSWVACGALLIIFSRFMPKRTAEGVRAYEHAKGFREYLATAEKYRIQWQEDQHMFERFLPYAMVFGIVGKWTATFKDLQLPPPSWYQGSAWSGGSFNAVAFAASFRGFESSLASAVRSSPSKSSSGSGFSGGFSGGGGGGGGGGSW
jgi:hypothetical protein